MRAQPADRFRIAVDTGGTFTDCVWLEDGALRVLKVFSTPADPAQAIANALRQAGPAGELLMLHGTTVGTNALLQRRVGRAALVANRGFEDVIQIGRQARPRLYDFFFDAIEPLAPAEIRFGIAGRIGPGGEVLEELPAAELDALRERIRAAAPQAVAVSLLFSFANPIHEQQVEAALRPLGIPLSLSHQVLPEFREYERASTVLVNACLQPVMQGYLKRLTRAAEEAAERARVFVMQSSGGITSLENAAREPVRTVLSGPAGGVVGASAMAQRSGVRRIITFDMGGTSTDVALVDSAPSTSSEGEVAGLPVRVPMLNIHTVGAGGGSLARFDAAGALRVGPESAGAVPGPICYGKGEQPTVTDANLLLGRLPAENFLGGGFTLEAKRARKFVGEWLRQHRSPLTAEQFAEGVIRVVNANMEKAIRVVSIERGYDPRDFSLVAFGGAGGLHACELAQSLGIPQVIVPAMPGALSAFGILVSEVVRELSRTVLWELGGDGPRKAMAEAFSRLERKAREQLKAEGWPGTPRLLRSADVRYRGQGFEINVQAGPRMLEHFHQEHQRRYGYNRPEAKVELVTLRLRASLPGAVAADAPLAPDSRRPSPARSIELYFDGKKLRGKLYDRAALQAGKRYSGPAVVAEYSATTFVPPGMKFRADKAGNILIQVPRG